MVRDPVERVISWYYYIRSVVKLKQHKANQNKLEDLNWQGSVVFCREEEGVSRTSSS